jgi:hypothetical protein
MNQPRPIQRITDQKRTSRKLGEATTGHDFSNDARYPHRESSDRSRSIAPASGLERLTKVSTIARICIAEQRRYSMINTLAAS